MITILRIKQISNIDHRPSKVQVQHNKTLETISSCFIRLIEALQVPVPHMGKLNRWSGESSVAIGWYSGMQYLIET
jgi:hypothetical protein